MISFKIKKILLFFIFIIFCFFLFGLFFPKNLKISFFPEKLEKPELFKKEKEPFFEKKLEKPIFLPPIEELAIKPIKIPKLSLLDSEEIIRLTNVQREKQGLLSLRKNEKLQKTALEKANDIIENQYFDHVSPSGKTVKDLIEMAGYEYVAIGENLALGTFENAESLVEAWMESPGHRENILKVSFEEIGVGVVKGIFQQKEVLVAVQHFARPLSSCPQPNQALKSEIEKKKQEIELLKNDLEVLEKEIEGLGLKNLQKIEEYNLKVKAYNDLIFKIKELIKKYNLEVENFNKCAQE